MTTNLRLIKMSMPDRVFLSSDTDVVRTHMVGIPLFRIPGTAAAFVEELLAWARATTILTTPFNRVPIRWPRRRWGIIEAAAVDFSHHVVRTTLPPPGSMRDLEAAVARIHSQPLDRAKPLWELHVIDGLADGRIALCLKVHHALMDAMTLVKLMVRTFTSHPDEDVLRPIWSLPPRSSNSAGNRRRLGVARTLGVMRELAAAAWRFLVEAWRPTDPAFAIPLRCPRSRRLNGRLSPDRSWAATEFDSARLRELAHRAGASLNELFLAALSTVLREYLGARGELPHRSLTAGVPASNRGPTADPWHDASGMILVNLFTDLPDPAERLRGIIRSSRLAKEHVASMSPQAADRYAVLTMAPALLQEVVGLSGRVRAPFNVTVSNVAGPSSPQYLFGAALDGLYAAAPVFHGQLLNLTVVSTGGRIGVSFTTCASAMGDTSRLAELFDDAIAELESVVRETAA